MPDATAIRRGFGNIRDNFLRNLNNLDIRGENYGMITSVLKKLINGGDSKLTALLRGDMTGRIRRNTNSRIREMKGNLAGSGLMRAGIGQAALTDIVGNESDALGSLEANLAQMNAGRADQALGRLMQLDSDIAGRALTKLLSGTQIGANLYGQGISLGQRQEQIDYNQRFNPADFLATLIGTGAQLGGSYLMADALKQQ